MKSIIYQIVTTVSKRTQYFSVINRIIYVVIVGKRIQNTNMMSDGMIWIQNNTSINTNVKQKEKRSNTNHASYARFSDMFDVVTPRRVCLK